MFGPRIRFLRIEDPDPKYSAQATEKIDANITELQHSGVPVKDIEPLSLLANDEKIALASFGNWLPGEKFHLWIDLSCIPKRYFFLQIKLALANPNIDTLIVTYTQPAPGRYTDRHLAENPGEVRPLPGFGPAEGEPQTLIVSVGFEALGLPQFLGEYRDKKRQIVCLIPFPPGQPYSRRIWQSIIAIGQQGGGPQLRRVPAIDAFATYGDLCNLQSPDDPIVLQNPPALAPYGPKPISIGMCLYAIRTRAAVFYTQPTAYHPEYTSGIGTSWAYCLKLNGELTF